VIAAAEPARASVGSAASGNGSGPGEASRAQGAAPGSTQVAAAAIGPPADAIPAGPQLPPRLDLAYKVFLGTQGFLIGDATYRFEHEDGDYRIVTVAQARGLAALFVHGRGVVESRGRITATGLKPAMFTIERGNADKREVARFDWERNVVTLHDSKDEPLSPLTFDPLTVLWQTYFTPPEGDVYRFSVATTRKVYHYTVTREGTDTIAWRGGSVLAQRWHRVNEENRNEAWFWLAPSMHYIPVKIRVTATRRGTVEALLDGMRSDSDPEVAAAEPPLEARTVTQQDPFAPRGQ
jgi:hypothetical protein